MNSNFFKEKDIINMPGFYPAVGAEDFLARVEELAVYKQGKHPGLVVDQKKADIVLTLMSQLFDEVV